MVTAFILLALFTVLIGYACCVAAGREDEQMERGRRQWENNHIQ